MKRTSEWPWGLIVGWLITINGAGWMWSLIVKDNAENVERKAQAIGRYEQVDSFYFKDGDYGKATVFKNRITGNCVMISGKYRSRIMTSVACPEANND